MTPTGPGDISRIRNSPFSMGAPVSSASSSYYASPLPLAFRDDAYHQLSSSSSKSAGSVLPGNTQSTGTFQDTYSFASTYPNFVFAITVFPKPSEDSGMNSSGFFADNDSSSTLLQPSALDRTRSALDIEGTHRNPIKLDNNHLPTRLTVVGTYLNEDNLCCVMYRGHDGNFYYSNPVSEPIPENPINTTRPTTTEPGLQTTTRTAPRTVNKKQMTEAKPVKQGFFDSLLSQPLIGFTFYFFLEAGKFTFLPISTAVELTQDQLKSIRDSFKSKKEEKPSTLERSAARITTATSPEALSRREQLESTLRENNTVNPDARFGSLENPVFIEFSEGIPPSNYFNPTDEVIDSNGKTYQVIEGTGPFAGNFYAVDASILDEAPFVFYSSDNVESNVGSRENPIMGSLPPPGLRVQFEISSEDGSSTHYTNYETRTIGGRRHHVYRGGGPFENAFFAVPEEEVASARIADAQAVRAARETNKSVSASDSIYSRGQPFPNVSAKDSDTDSSLDDESEDSETSSASNSTSGTSPDNFVTLSATSSETFSTNPFVTSQAQSDLLQSLFGWVPSETRIPESTSGSEPSTQQSSVASAQDHSVAFQNSNLSDSSSTTLSDNFVTLSSNESSTVSDIFSTNPSVTSQEQSELLQSLLGWVSPETSNTDASSTQNDVSLSSSTNSNEAQPESLSQVTNKSSSNMSNINRSVTDFSLQELQSLHDDMLINKSNIFKERSLDSATLSNNKDYQEAVEKRISTLNEKLQSLPEGQGPAQLQRKLLSARIEKLILIKKDLELQEAAYQNASPAQSVIETAPSVVSEASFTYTSFGNIPMPPNPLEMDDGTPTGSSEENPSTPSLT